MHGEHFSTQSAIQRSNNHKQKFSIIRLYNPYITLALVKSWNRQEHMIFQSKWAQKISHDICVRLSWIL